MTRGRAEDEFKRNWQTQPREKMRMSLEQIREKGLRLQRIRRLVGWTTLPVFVLCTLFFVFVLVRAAKGPLWISAYGASAGGRLLWIAVDRLPIIPIGVGIYLIHLSISFFIRTKTLASDSGLKPSVAVYRDYFEWERRVRRRIFAVLAVSMIGFGLDAAGWWMRVSTFPLQDALQFGLGYALVGVLIYIAQRHHRFRLRREFRLLDDLEAGHG
jgi:hypothetical protein